MRASAPPAQRLGEQCVVLGHHYQRDEVIQFADFHGDSWRLQRAGQPRPRTLHRLLRRALHGRIGRRAGRPGSADHPAGFERRLLHGRHGRDLARWRPLGAVRRAWADRRRRQGHHAADVYELGCRHQSLLGERGGAVCTSSERAGRRFAWGFERNQKIFFLPDQHLGRNTGYRHGHSAERDGGVGSLPAARRIDAGAVCAGHGSSCGRATARCISGFCRSTWSRCARGILASRSSCIPSAAGRSARRPTTSAPRTSCGGWWREAPAGAKFAIGTEIHLVNRLAKEHPDKMVDDAR